jgi:hypothetical protein
LKLSLLTAAIGFPMSWILIGYFQLGVVGLAFTMAVAGIPSLIIALLWLKKNYGVTIDWLASVRILLSALVASAITYVIITYFVFSNWVALIIGAALFFCSFVFAVLFTRAITRVDIKNLRDMLGGLGSLRRPLTFALNIVEKLMNILRI